LNITADLRAEIVALSTDNLDTFSSKCADLIGAQQPTRTIDVTPSYATPRGE
jgi:hypothetical protein